MKATFKFLNLSLHSFWRCLSIPLSLKEKVLLIFTFKNFVKNIIFQKNDFFPFLTLTREVKG